MRLGYYRTGDMRLGVAPNTSHALLCNSREILRQAMAGFGQRDINVHAIQRWLT